MAQTTIRKQLWTLSSLLMGVLFVSMGAELTVGGKIDRILDDLGEIDLPATRTATVLDMQHDGLKAVVMSSIVYSGSKDSKVLGDLKNDLKKTTEMFDTQLAELDKFALDQPTKDAIAKAKPTITRFVKAGNSVFDRAIVGEAEKAIEQLPEFEKEFDTLDKELDVISELIVSHGHKSQTDADQLQAVASKLNYGLLILGLLLGTGLSFLIIRGLNQKLHLIIQNLQNQSNGLQNSSSEMNSASSTLLTSSSAQASAVQETAASMEEISAMMQKTSEGAVELNASAKASADSAASGLAAVSDMRQVMSHIHESNQRVLEEVKTNNTKIEEIAKTIGQIGERTKVINDIAFQTRILSFNASVEAARAGENGKGFAVVAEEVGKLAQMSGEAAKEITNMLQAGIDRTNTIIHESASSMANIVAESKAKIETGMTVAQSCGDSIASINQQVKHLENLTLEISAAIEEQGKGVKEVSSAVQLFSDAATKTSAASHQTDSLAKSLNSESTQIIAIIQELSNLVDERGSNGNTHSISRQLHYSLSHNDQEDSEPKAA